MDLIPTTGLRSNHPLAAIGFRAGVSNVIALPIEADDEHGPSMAIALRLVGRDGRRVFTFGRDVTSPLAEAAMTKFIGAAKELNAIVSVVRSKHGLHGAEVLIAKRQKVRAHRKRV